MKDYYKWAKDFADKHIVPVSAEIDEKGVYPIEIFEKIAEEGFYKILVPTEFGGEGKGITEHALITKAFAEACATIGLCYTMSNVALKFTLTFGRDEIKQQVIEDVVKNNKFLSLARSEFGTGVHVFNSQTQTENHDDYSIINGTKSMITSANHASYYLISVPADEKRGPVNWLVPLEAEGLSFSESDWHGLGMRANNSCPMHMKDMKLDNKYAIYIDRVKANQKYPVNIDVIYFMAGLSAVYAGLTKTIYEEGKKHALDRKYPGDRNLANIETVQLYLTDLYTNAFAAETMLNEATRAIDAEEVSGFEKIMATRAFVSGKCVESGTIAMKIGGGQVYNKKGPLERLMRDALAAPVMFPSMDVLRIWTAKIITGQPLM